MRRRFRRGVLAADLHRCHREILGVDRRGARRRAGVRAAAVADVLCRAARRRTVRKAHRAGSPGRPATCVDPRRRRPRRVRGISANANRLSEAIWRWFRGPLWYGFAPKTGFEAEDKMAFGKAISTGFKKSVNFGDRPCRSEFWY